MDRVAAKSGQWYQQGILPEKALWTAVMRDGHCLRLCKRGISCVAVVGADMSIGSIGVTAQMSHAAQMGTVGDLPTVTVGDLPTDLKKMFTEEKQERKIGLIG
jgi:hypothetical protein